MSKRNVTVIWPRDVEPIRIRETLRIAVRRRHDGPDHLLLSNPLSAQFSVLRSHSRWLLAGTFIPKQLLHRRWDKREIGAELFELIRIAEQCKDAIANQIRSGFLSTNHRYYRVSDHFVFRQSISRNLRIHERTDQTVRPQILLAHRGTKICRHLFRGLQKLRYSVGIVLKVSQYFGEVL